MTDVLIIFGSNSDKQIYEKIQTNIKNSHSIVCSAHRSPDILNEVLKNTPAKIFVAGAGLAAHLPGVIASKTIKPVIGVPVNSNFQGLDSLLSIVQMPPGIPVMCVGVNNSFEAAKYAKLMLKQFNAVTIIGDVRDKNNEKVIKAIEVLNKFEVPYEFSQEVSEKNINLHFGEFAMEKGLTINIPLIDSSKIENATKLLHLMQNGLWVGLGRGENAAIAAVEILNLDGTYTQKLNNYRLEMKNKIIEEMKKNG